MKFYRHGKVWDTDEVEKAMNALGDVAAWLGFGPGGYGEYPEYQETLLTEGRAIFKRAKRAGGTKSRRR